MSLRTIRNFDCGVLFQQPARVSLDTLQILLRAGECHFYAGGQQRVCYFRDFWHDYEVFIDQDGVVETKRRAPVRELVYPASFLNSRHQRSLYEALAFLLAAAVIGSIWFVHSGRPRAAR